MEGAAIAPQPTTVDPVNFSMNPPPPRRTLPPYLVDLLAVLLLLGLTAFFFWRLWAPNPADRVAFPIGDFTDQYYPLRAWVVRLLAEGQLPFWNPFIFGGQPGLADPQAATFYPATWLHAWRGGVLTLQALQGEAVAHLFVAALGGYAFARGAQRLAPLPALLTAVTFGFGGYLTGFPLEQITILETMAWLPWLLLAAHCALRAATLAQRLAATVVAAVLYAVALLAGHPQSALYLSYLTLAYALFLLVTEPSRDGWGPRLGRAVGLLLFPLGVGLAALQLLPTRAFIALSSRQALDFNFVQSGVEWQGLIELLLPKLVGSNPLYVGILPLLLAPLAFFHKKRWASFFWLGAAIIALLLSFGGQSALFDALYLGLPGLSAVRNQERILVVWSWALALLAGNGLQWLWQCIRHETARAALHRYLRGVRSLLPALLFVWLLLWAIYIAGTSAFRREQLIFYYDVFYGFLALYGRFAVAALLSGLLLFTWSHINRPHQRALLASLLLALLIWDLFTVNRGYHLGPPPEQALSPANEIVSTLQAESRDGRQRVAILGQPSPRANDGMRWGIPLLSGNEPLQLALSHNFLTTASTWPQLQAFAAPFLVAERALSEEAPDAYETVVATDLPTVSTLSRTRPPMPYAWLVGATETVTREEDILAILRDQPPNLHEVALLTNDVPITAPPLPPGQGVTVLRHDSHIAIRVENPAPSAMLLVVAEPSVAGWHALLDGEEVAIQRANAFNIALTVPSGEHRVALHYEAPGWERGRWISVGSGVALIALALLSIALDWRERNPSRKRHV
ncbi:MAG: YfhO family protein [Anaerolineales bacterium]|nr:YfhO family protein [Anaerolineales bacterium]